MTFISNTTKAKLLRRSVVSWNVCIQPMADPNVDEFDRLLGQLKAAAEQVGQKLEANATTRDEAFAQQQGDLDTCRGAQSDLESRIDAITKELTTLQDQLAEEKGALRLAKTTATTQTKLAEQANAARSQLGREIDALQIEKATREADYQKALEIAQKNQSKTQQQITEDRQRINVGLGELLETLQQLAAREPQNLHPEKSGLRIIDPMHLVQL